MTTTDWTETHNGHTDHEEAGVTGERASASSRVRNKPWKPGEAMADATIRAYLVALVNGEIERLKPTKDTGSPLERVNSGLVIDKLTAAATELRAG